MATVQEKNEWRKAAEARIKNNAKEAEAEHGRQLLESEIRLERAAAKAKGEMKRKAAVAFGAAGGSPAMFEKDWDTIYDQMVIQETMRNLDKVRSADDPVSRL